MLTGGTAETYGAKVTQAHLSIECICIHVTYVTLDDQLLEMMKMPYIFGDPVTGKLFLTLSICLGLYIP